MLAGRFAFCFYGISYLESFKKSKKLQNKTIHINHKDPKDKKTLSSTPSIFSPPLFFFFSSSFPSSRRLQAYLLYLRISPKHDNLKPAFLQEKIKSSIPSRFPFPSFFSPRPLLKKKKIFFFFLDYFYRALSLSSIHLPLLSPLLIFLFLSPLPTSLV